MEIQQPKWKKLEHSKKAVEKAGSIIRKNDATEERIHNAIMIIDNWRAAHAYPLHVIYMNLRRKFSTRNDVIIAERLKRLDSIVGKLKRENGMSLWRMQDLGGCRVIVPTLAEVYSAAKQFEDSKKRHILVEENDYIKSPKESGYRSLHRVYKFHSDKKEEYNKNMLIEIQFRTHLQHIWATAVETMGLYTKESIKSGQGSDDVKRFFVLISSLFALKENCPIIPKTIGDVDELISEIEEINSRCKILDALSAMKMITKLPSNSGAYYLMLLNYDKKTLRVKSYKASALEKATHDYNQIEREIKLNSKFDVVLVRVSSLNELRSAYPNYFSDIGEFVELVQDYLK